MDQDYLMFIDSLRANSLPGPRPAPSLAAGRSGNSESTVFVLDRSGSMGDQDFPPSRFLAGVHAIVAYLQAKLRVSRGEDAGLVVFDQTARILQEWTPLSDAIPAFEAALLRIGLDGGTDIAKGLKAAGKLIAIVPSNVRKRIVLLTDGHGGKPEPTAAMLKKSGVIIDVIGIGKSPADVNESCLRQVASIVNGKTRYRFIGQKDSLLEHFETIATDLMCVRG